MKTVYILCCNDSLVLAYFNEQEAQKEADKRQKEVDSKNGTGYWHVHEVEVAE